MKLTLTSRPQHRDNILSQEAAGTMVLLSLHAGKYYSLENTGVRAWELCDGQRSVSEIASILASEFDSPIERIQNDLIELIADLANENLVTFNQCPSHTSFMEQN